MTASETIQLKESRFARLEAIEWWDQSLLSRSRILVIGAGALGNEVIKNLALLGVGHVAIADMDRIELSNLSRSALFREKDEGKFKAECAARAAMEIYPGMRVTPLVGNVLAEVGLGWFRWANVVLGALDNREARVFVNSACARVGRPWVDGGIEVLQGIARGFAPPATACYECTMSQVDWDLLNQRRSCSLIARRAISQRGVPTTPTTASIIGAVQAQEAIKLLHGRKALVGRGFVFEGAEHSSYAVNYSISPDCPWHEEPAPIETRADFDSNTPFAKLWDEAGKRFGALDALDLAREIVEALECSKCAERELILQPAEKVRDNDLRCAKCGSERAGSFINSITAESPHLKKSAREMGLPPWDVVWARHGERSIGFELSGDQPREI